MYPGEYTQPLVRKTLVQVPVVSGYVAARLQAQDWVLPVTSGPGTYFMATYENVGNTWFAVLLQECDDRSISGVRLPIGASAASLCPGGQTVVTGYTSHHFLEVWCTGTTTGNLRMQFESQRQYTEMGFDKVDDATFYPTSLWQATEYPGPVMD
jgi:hypothetical protein